MDSASGLQARSPKPHLPPAVALIETAGAAGGLDPSSLPAIALPRKARIMVVEDHAFVRAGVVRLINRQEDLLCCGESDSVAGTPALVAKEKPDLILLDL